MNTTVNFTYAPKKRLFSEIAESRIKDYCAVRNMECSIQGYGDNIFRVRIVANTEESAEKVIRDITSWLTQIASLNTHA